MSYSKTDNQKTLTLALFTIYLLVLIWLILFKGQFFVPVMDEGRILNLVPLMGSLDQNGVLQLSEIRINILVFIPLGIFLSMLKANWNFVKKLFVIVGVTLALEITQYIFVIGRADITDVLSNTLGGIIGIGIYVILSKLLLSKTHKVINGLAMTTTIILFLFISILLLSHHWVIIK